MIYNEIDKLIADAMKNHDNMRLDTLRMIKSKFLEYKTSKGAKEMNEATEVSILRKMVSERMDDIKMFLAAGRDELVPNAQAEINIVKEFLPAEVTEEQIAKAYENVLKQGIEPIKKNMGMFIKNIKAELPTADGKAVSEYVSKHLS